MTFILGIVARCQNGYFDVIPPKHKNCRFRGVHEYATGREPIKFGDLAITKPV